MSEGLAEEIVTDGVPRRAVRGSATGNMGEQLRQLRQDISDLQRGATLRNASVSGGDGLRVLDANGDLRITLNTTDGAVVAYDATGTPVARFGPTDYSDPGSYGVEVFVEGVWVKLGAQVAAWTNIAGRPGVSGGATVDGSFITGTVPAATTAGSATSAGHADDADGSASGFARTVGGTEFYALWVDNTSGFKFGRNVSSRKYKQNIRPWDGDPKAALKLAPVWYERKPRAAETLEDGAIAAPATSEFGLIAEDAAAVLPELATTYQGEIDGVRYDLVGVALIPVLNDHEEQLAEQADRIQKLEAAVRALGGTV